MERCFALVVTGQFQYGAAYNFLMDIAKELNKLAITPIFYNLTPDKSVDNSVIELFRLTEHKNICFSLSINGLGLDYLASFDRLRQLPCFSWLLDHPVHHLHRIAAHRDFVRLLCVDQSHCSWLLQRGFQAYEFYHAVALNPVPAHPATIPPMITSTQTAIEQDIGVFFPASYFAESQHIANIQAAHPRLLEMLLDPAIQDLADLCTLLKLDTAAAVPATDLNLLNLLRLADLFLRGRNRNQLVQDCADAGIQLVIAGQGWQESVFARQHILLGSVPYVELPSWIRRSQFVLHHHPGFVAGLHERLLMALSCGTAVLTPQQSFLQQMFSQADGLYGFAQVSDLHHLALNSHQGCAVAQSTALAGHSWSVRTAQLLELAQLQFRDVMVAG